MTHIEICDDAATVARWAATALIDDLRSIQQSGQTGVWVAAGGSTPAKAYEIIAKEDAHQIDWSNLYILIGDERCVPLSHKDSNWRQLADLLLAHVPVSASHLLRPPMELGAIPAASRYAEMIAQLPGEDTPKLHHVWLGMGEDGHTLSLFPGEELAEHIGAQLVAPILDSPKPPPERITLTLNALRGAEHCVILATGGGKRPALTRALSGDLALPIARAANTVERNGGRVTWVLDREAAPISH